MQRCKKGNSICSLNGSRDLKEGKREREREREKTTANTEGACLIDIIEVLRAPEARSPPRVARHDSSLSNSNTVDSKRERKADESKQTCS